jgi:uncharacterized paraquat-inducible protein A
MLNKKLPAPIYPMKDEVYHKQCGGYFTLQAYEAARSMDDNGSICPRCEHKITSEDATILDTPATLAKILYEGEASNA